MMAADRKHAPHMAGERFVAGLVNRLRTNETGNAGASADAFSVELVWDGSVAEALVVAPPPCFGYTFAVRHAGFCELALQAEFPMELSVLDSTAPHQVGGVGERSEHGDGVRSRPLAAPADRRACPAKSRCAG